MRQQQKALSGEDAMLQGRAALVTGSTSGIGYAIAEALAAEGCQIMMNGFGDANEIEDMRAAMAKRHSVEVRYSGADLTEADQIEGLVDDTVSAFGSFDILVNCAGIQIIAPIDEFPLDGWDAMIAIHLSATFHTTRLALPHMKERRWGRIVNMGSAHGLVASPYKAPYVAAKHGVVGFTKATALEAGAWQITCNAICPGFVKTPMYDLQAEGLAEQEGQDLEEFIQAQVGTRHALPNIISVEEIAGTVIFLCSDSGRSISGTTISVDAGWTAT
jgi:3-hydroxybutyrate dehydrogenase